MGEDYKKYNSDAEMTVFNARLAKDAEVKGDNFVKLTTVVTSKNEHDEDMWFDAIPIDRDAPVAEYLKKGDVLTLTGFPTMRRYGDDNAKVGLTLKNVKLHMPISLFMECKDRGFEPGAASGGNNSKKPAAKKPVGKKPAPVRREVEPVADDDDLPF